VDLPLVIVEHGGRGTGPERQYARLAPRERVAISRGVDEHSAAIEQPAHELPTLLWRAVGIHEHTAHRGGFDDRGGSPALKLAAAEIRCVEVNTVARSPDEH